MRTESVPLFTREYFSSRTAQNLVRYGLQTGCSSQGCAAKGSLIASDEYFFSPMSYSEIRFSGCSLSFHSNNYLDAAFPINPMHV